MVPSPTSEVDRGGCCSACDDEGNDGEANERRRRWMTVADGSCGCCFTHKRRRKRKIGLGA